MEGPIYLYGIYDPGLWRERFRAAGVTGWVVFEETIGADPEDPSGRGPLYAAWAEAGFGVLVVLNYGRYPNGTLPPSDRYDDFARRCARFVAASPGARIWIIGNEPNHPQQQPGARVDPTGRRCEAAEWITPERYARCFRRCREAIRSLPGHADDWVIPAAVAPFTATLRYPGNPTGDWVIYFHDLLSALGEDLDGIALHVASQSPDPQALATEARCPPPYEARRAGFRAYRDFLEALPPHRRSLPIFITEASMGDRDGRPIPWPDADTGWITAAYAEIHHWNADPAHPPIRAMTLYRWQRVDPWFMEGKPGLLPDLDRALAARLRWDVGLARYPFGTLREALALRDRPEGRPAGTPCPAGSTGRVVERTADGAWCLLLLPETGRQGWVPRAALALQGPLEAVPVARAGPVFLRSRRAAPLYMAPAPDAPSQGFLGEGQRALAVATTADRGWWRVRLPEGLGWVRAPDVAIEGNPQAVPVLPQPWTTETLARLDLALHEAEALLPHPGARAWPRRPPALIRWLVLHPLPVPGDMSPLALARRWCDQGRRGFPYHFYLTAEGRVFWTLPLEAMTDHAGGYGRTSIGIALAGCPPGAMPTAAQADAAARLCAWLALGLGRDLSQIQALADLFPEGARAEPSPLAQRIQALARQRLAEAGLPAPGLPPPGWIDMLPAGEPAPPPRPLLLIRALVLHQTGTDPAVPPEAVAARGAAGPGYHFLVSPEGVLYRLHPLTAAISHLRAHNAATVSIGLMGDFRRWPPEDRALTAAARLIAYLLEHLGLDPGAVQGHGEVDPAAADCPGSWLGWKPMLLAQVEAIRRVHARRPP